MLAVADILRLPGAAYRAQFGDRMLPSHRRAMPDIEACRTETLGGQLYYCPQGDAPRYSYHSCKNRHCPKCQNEQANEWLEEQKSLLLPVPYFMVTFTLPAALRALARSNQKTIYHLLFRASSAALLQLARRALSKFVTTVCSAPRNGHGCGLPDNCSQPPPVNQSAATTTALKTTDPVSKTTETPRLLSCPQCRGPLTLLAPLTPRGRPP